MARLMCVAAVTAPKCRGRNRLTVATLSVEERDRLAREMRSVTEESGARGFARDADGVESAGAVVLLGVRSERSDLDPCSFCGFGNCDEMEAAGGACGHCLIDLGIAVGSAVSVAADHRVDNRVLYTAGLAAMRIGLLPSDLVAAVGIPLSATAKNPYFDRRPK
ncbi:MAG: ferredoxin [Firmicutes bacterium]|nr:ferredoxin [Bacillota bacterium]